MSDTSQAATTEKPEEISMADFLEATPPDTQVLVSDLGKRGYSGGVELSTPDISLHCHSAHCDGEQRFKYEHGNDSLPDSKWRFSFITYACRNCGETRKVFALAVMKRAGFSGLAQKFGEIPPFGPEVPARVISLIGPDRDIFLRGRRSENHGLGIGAFSYYRRVVEKQKNRIIGEMAKVAERLGASKGDLSLFHKALEETQFSNAVDKIKTAIPSALLIDGHHNPLTLLHDALSDGIHERSDEGCLESAREIRLVLTNLAERMAEVLKSDAELKDAVSKLLGGVASKKTSAPTTKS
jgi:hypothetical protein